MRGFFVVLTTVAAGFCALMGILQVLGGNLILVAALLAASFLLFKLAQNLQRETNGDG